MVEPIYYIFGDEVKKARNKIGLTQSSLAQKIGLCRVSIANIESANSRTSLHVACDICRELHLDFNLQKREIESNKDKILQKRKEHSLIRGEIKALTDRLRNL